MTVIEAGSSERVLGRKRQVLADAALVVVTLIWGATFVLVKDIVHQVSPLYFLTFRFAIGAFALAVIITLARRWSGFSVRELGWGSLIGVAIGIGYALQTIGLQYTSASNAAFITGLLVVLAPVIGLIFLRQRPSRWSVLGVIMATVGLAMLSLRFDEGINPNGGDAIVLGCAFAFAFQVVLIAHVSRLYDPLRVAFVQVLVAGVLNSIGSLIFESPQSLSPQLWAGAAFMGIMATAVAIGVQTSVQSYTTVVHASLIFTLEPVFAAIFGFTLQGDRLGPIALTGAALIVCGMLIAELGPYIRRRASRRILKAEREN